MLPPPTLPQQIEISAVFSSSNMAADPSPHDPVDEDYIDMDFSSATLFCYPISPPHSTREFEFHMSSNVREEKATTSPADELFYKGKLLPLHLPPRLHMVQKLLHSTSVSAQEPPKAGVLESHWIADGTATPSEPCNFSPSESLPVSREINPEEYSPDAGFKSQSKKSWSGKLKLIRHSSLGLKLKASRTYLKSLFSRTGCSDESDVEECAAPSPRAKDCLSKYLKRAKKNPFGLHTEKCAAEAAANGEDEMVKNGGNHRSSFSGAIKWHSGTKTPPSASSSSSNCSSSSSSASLSEESSRFFELRLLKRSSSASSEVESSIQGAIAYCKQTQQPFCARKSVSMAGIRSSMSAPQI